MPDIALIKSIPDRWAFMALDLTGCAFYWNERIRNRSFTNILRSALMPWKYPNSHYFR